MINEEIKFWFWLGRRLFRVGFELREYTISPRPQRPEIKQRISPRFPAPEGDKRRQAAVTVGREPESAHAKVVA
jgi:hypothetical protein